MGGPGDEEFQHGHGVLSTDAPYRLSYDQEFDDDGKPKRTGIFSFLFTLLFHYLVFTRIRPTQIMNPSTILEARIKLFLCTFHLATFWISSFRVKYRKISETD